MVNFADRGKNPSLATSKLVGICKKNALSSAHGLIFDIRS